MECGQLPEVVCRNEERIVSETFCHWHPGNVFLEVVLPEGRVLTNSVFEN